VTPALAKTPRAIAEQLGHWVDTDETPGNILLSESATGLSKESVANVSQIVTLDKSKLTVRVGKLPKAKLELVLSGVDVVLGR
jgi:mRNA interferase MazF